MIRRWHGQAIRRLFSLRWQQEEAPGACVLLSLQPSHYSTEQASEAALPLQAPRVDVRYTQYNGDVKDNTWCSPAGDLLAAEMVFAQNEDEDDLPISAQPRWKSMDEATRPTWGVLQTGALSKRLLKLPSHSPVVPSLQKWVSEGHALTKNIVVVALTNLKREGRYKQAFEVVDFVWRERVYVMDDVDHMYRLYLMGRTGSVEDVEKCFASIPTKWLTEKVYNQLISCYIARGMLPHAKNALEKLKTSGQSISAVAFNQFMTLYRHQRQPSKALELIKEMHLTNVSPDTRTYNLLLSTIMKQNDVDGVRRNHKAMKDAGIAPNILTFSIVGKAYVAAGMLQEAEVLASEMQKLSPRNSHLAHDLLLAVYAELKRPEDLKRVWKDAEKLSKLSARSYGVMIESLGKLGLIQEAEKLAFRAEKIKRKLPARVYNALMDVYSRHGMMEAAEALLVRIHKEGSAANCVTYRHLVTGYLKLCQFDKAAQYMRASRKILRSEFSKPWFESFLLFIDYLAERGEADTAERFFKYFTTPNMYRNTSAYNTLLKAYVKARINAPNFLQRMCSDGVQPDAKTLALLSELESIVDRP